MTILSSHSIGNFEAVFRVAGLDLNFFTMAWYFAQILFVDFFAREIAFVSAFVGNARASWIGFRKKLKPLAFFGLVTLRGLRDLDLDFDFSM